MCKVFQKGATKDEIKGDDTRMWFKACAFAHVRGEKNVFYTMY